MTKIEDFSIFTWSMDVPLCDDVWLGMQARNIALIDMAIIRGIETEALQRYFQEDRTPSDTLMILSALSQMWVFSLYEFLRTWRQRAASILEAAEKYFLVPDKDKDSFIETEIKKAKGRESFVKSAPTFYSEHVSRISDKNFTDALKSYFDKTEPMFRQLEALRVTLAKHEVPKTRGFAAEAPGYGRMSYETGSMYWFFNLKDGTVDKLDRREIADEFLGIEESCFEDHPILEKPSKPKSRKRRRKRGKRGGKHARARKAKSPVT